MKHIPTIKSIYILLLLFKGLACVICVCVCVCIREEVFSLVGLLH